MFGFGCIICKSIISQVVRTGHQLMPVLVGSPFKHPSLLRCKVICPPERSIDILYTAFINPIPMGKGIDPQTAEVISEIERKMASTSDRLLVNSQ